MKNILQDSFWTGAMSIMQIISGLGLSILLARTLEPAGRGAYILVLLIIGTIGYITNPSIYASANYFLSSNYLKIEQIILPTFILGLGSSILGFIVSAISCIWFTDTSKTLGMTTTIMIALGTSMYSLGITLNGVLYGLRRIPITTSWAMLLGFLQFIAACLVAFFTTPSVQSFVTLYVGTLLMDVIVKIIFCCRELTTFPQYNSRSLIDMLRYGISVYMGRTLTLLSQRVDTYILYIFAGQTILGYYSIASSLAEQLWILPSSVGLVMMTNIARYEQQEAASITAATSRMALTIPLLAALLFGAIGPWLIPFLYGQQYQPSVIPFLIILPGVVAIGSFAVIEPFFQSRGKPLIPVSIAGIGAIVNLCLSLAFIPSLGMHGAAIAYSLSYAIQLAVACLLFTRITGFTLWSLIDIRLAMSDMLRIAQLRFATHTERSFLK